MSAKQLLNYLSGLPDRPGNRVIAGQHVGYHIEYLAIDYVKTVVGLHDLTGKWPGLIGTTYGLGATAAEIAAGNPLLVDYWNEGGLVTIDHMANNPWTGGDPGDLEKRDLVELITPGTAVYDVWMAELDKVAAGLTELRDIGVVVLWRPFHECTFDRAAWWDSGAHPGDPQPFINMWRHMFDYFTHEKGLDNLLWVYCAADTNNWNPVDILYPGGEYADLVGVDVYSDLGTARAGTYDRLLALNKPLFWSELGPGSTLDGTFDNVTYIDAIREYYPRVSLFQVWHSWADHDVAIVDNRNASVLLSDPWVVTRDEVRWVKFRIEGMLTQAGTDRLYVDVAFLDAEGRVSHRNDFIMDISPECPDVAAAICGNIAAYVGRTNFDVAVTDRRDLQIQTEDTDPLGLRAAPGVADLVGVEL